jgi:hypothetical protein
VGGVTEPPKERVRTPGFAEKKALPGKVTDTLKFPGAIASPWAVISSPLADRTLTVPDMVRFPGSTMASPWAVISTPPADKTLTLTW